MVSGPGHASHRGGDREFVANGLLLAPFSSHFVDEDDIVALGNCDLGRVGGKFKSSNEVGLLAFVGGFGWELVFLLPSVVKEINRLC